MACSQVKFTFQYLTLKKLRTKNVRDLIAALNNLTKLDHVQKLGNIKTIIIFLCYDTDLPTAPQLPYTLRTHKELIFQRRTQTHQ